MLFHAAPQVQVPRPQVVAKSGYYEGSAGVYDVDFQISGDTVRNLESDFEATVGSGCVGVSGTPDYAHFPTVTMTHGKFSASTGSSDRFRISATVKSATVITGQVSDYTKLNGFPPCAATSSFTAHDLGPTKASAVSSLTVTTGTRTMTFTGITAQFGTTLVYTPTTGMAGSALVDLGVHSLSAAQKLVLAGPVGAATMHLVLASPFTDATYRFSDVSSPTLSFSTGDGDEDLSFDYTNVQKG